MANSLDLDACIEQLRECKYLLEPAIREICDIVRAMLIEVRVGFPNWSQSLLNLAQESNVQPVSSPVTVCGDIHGQLWDLIELLRVGGDCPGTSYVFMVRAGRLIPWDVRLTTHRATLWTGATTRLRPFPFCSASKLGARDDTLSTGRSSHVA